MAENSNIEWTTHTFNPWRGCTKVSEGCRHCYAETMSKRNPKVLGIWGNNGTRVVASESMWREPVKWNESAFRSGRRDRVFCGSLCDVCEDRRELTGPRLRLKELIAETPYLDWLLLTKRPENYERLFWMENRWPSNVWAGTSVENQAAADERIPHLLKCPAAVRFLSCEPLLGPIDLTSVADNGHNAINALTGNYIKNDHVFEGQCVDWVIVGGESGPGARPCNVAWIRNVVKQCEDAVVACFVKQLGAYPVCTIEGATFNKHDHGMFIGDRKGGDPSEWPENLRVREFPKAGA